MGSMAGGAILQNLFVRGLESVVLISLDFLKLQNPELSKFKWTHIVYINQ